MKYTITVSLLLLMLASCTDNEPQKQPTKDTKTVQYKLATVQQGGVASVIKLPAQLAAFQEVSIFPKVNGYVKQVLVDIGSNVSAGTLLMTLEAPELEQAALQAREKYARTKADYSIDKERYNRLLEANRTPGAISPMDLSTVKAKLEADSALCNAEKANWQMQQTMLGYLQVRAPFAGTITERNVHPGALVNATVKDRPMLELKQNSHLRLQVDVPETMSANLQQQDTVSFYVASMPGKKMIGRVARKSSNVNYQLRNERIEVDVPNNDGRLASGMYADVALYTKGNNTALSVPKTAVVVSTERKYVVAVRNGKAQKIDVVTGASTSTTTEVFGELRVGEQVIENASDEIKEGTAIE